MNSTRLIQALQRGFVLAALASLTACVVAPVAPRLVAEGVVTAPPALQTEVVGATPAPGYLWIGGY
jgi:hypothetical protein